MKKFFNTLLVLVLVAAVAVFVIAKAVNKAPKADLPLAEQAMQVITDGGCLDCHAQVPNFPWYRSLPVIGNVLEKDAAIAVRFIDMENTLAQLESGAGMSLPDVVRIETSAANRTMPPAKYAVMHWKSPLTKAKSDILCQWLADYRHANYPNGNAPAFADEPIFAIPDVAPLAADPAKVALGEALYNDVRLSLDNTISCSTCHVLAQGGVDNKQLSEGVNGGIGGVNAPTVLNAVFNFVQFWDGRAATLALQAAGPPVNPVEMASESFDQIIAKLKADKAFMREFGKVYDEVTEATITDAIEHYERTLITPNGAFDRYLKGEENAIDAEAVEGYALFKEYNCAGCHSGFTAGGQSYEYMGLKRDYFADRVSDLSFDDNGHLNVSGRDYDLHRFKVPGLRNVAYTFPYFHDGTRGTLEEAVRDMALYQYDITLSEAQIARITAFLKTL